MLFHARMKLAFLLYLLFLLAKRAIPVFMRGSVTHADLITDKSSLMVKAHSCDY